MDKFEIIVPCLFGMEAFVSKEIKRLGYETTHVEDGKITFLGDIINPKIKEICLKFKGAGIYAT